MIPVNMYFNMNFELHGSPLLWQHYYFYRKYCYKWACKWPETSLLLFKGQGKDKSNDTTGLALEAPPHKCTPEEVTFNVLSRPHSLGCKKCAWRGVWKIPLQTAFCFLLWKRKIQNEIKSYFFPHSFSYTAHVYMLTCTCYVR